MSFREFTANILSTRDFEETRLKSIVVGEITEYLKEINAGIGKEKGFSFIMFDNGDEIYDSLKGVGGYSGVMIKSPYYIGLTNLKEEPEIDFYGAYYMQSVVRKLYEMELGSCWINIRSIPYEMKSKLLKNHAGNINYLLAFGIIDEKAVKQKAPQLAVENKSDEFRQDPYGTRVNEAADTDKARHSLLEIVYLHEWGKPAAYEDLESRGMADIFYYVRNAPSYKNLQPCRLILKDGEVELALLNPEKEGSYIDAGIMMYTMEGLAKDMGIPAKWHFIKQESKNKEYSVAAKIEL